MKKWIDKAKEFVKKNYIACTVVGALVLVVIASLIIVGLIKSFKNRIEAKEVNGSYYQYFNTEKSSFDATLYLENDEIVNIEANKYNLYKNSPIYYEDSKGMIIPKEYAVVFYLRDNMTYRLSKYSYITFDDDIHFINSKGNKENNDSFFLYDGEDTYVTSKAAKLKVNGNEIAISSDSYVTANKDYVIYYDQVNDQIGKIENIQSASLILPDVAIDLLKDVTVKNGEVNLLINEFSKLETYLED